MVTHLGFVRSGIHLCIAGWNDALCPPLLRDPSYRSKTPDAVREVRAIIEIYGTVDGFMPPPPSEGRWPLRSISREYHGEVLATGFSRGWRAPTMRSHPHTSSILSHSPIYFPPIVCVCVSSRNFISHILSFPILSIAFRNQQFLDPNHELQRQRQPKFLCTKWSHYFSSSSPARRPMLHLPRRMDRGRIRTSTPTARAT